MTAATKWRKTSKSTIAREALEAYFKNEQTPVAGSLLDRMRDLVGRFEGPEDLATNKKYMDDYGR